MSTQERTVHIVLLHVGDNVRALIQYLCQKDDHDYIEEVSAVCTRLDYETSAYEQGYDVKKNEYGSFYITGPDDGIFNGPYDTKEQAWRDACEANSIEPYIDEAYEWYLVSSWLARKLEARGEMVEKIFGMNIWGRCVSGQAIYTDDVITDIYETSTTPEQE